MVDTASHRGFCVQLIESSVLGLRSARHRFVSSDHQMSVTLFPMVHIGAPSFYQQVYDDAFGHDVVLYEGVASPIVRNLTRSYRWIEKSNLGLITQPKAIQIADHPAAINADLTGDEFELEWRALPMWMRLLIPVLAPVYGLKQRWFATRASLVKGRNLNDKRTRAQNLNWSPGTELWERAVLQSRDERLCATLLGMLEENTETSGSIAIVFGARHMPAVVRALTRYRDFRVESSKWMTVFSA